MQQDNYASSWSLKSVELPSGGKIELDYEADDYQFVQNKRALQMFKVKGVCKTEGGELVSKLYDNNLNGHAKYVVVQVNQEDSTLPPSTIIEKYVGELNGKPIYFNFNMNVTGGTAKDFVPGYFELGGEAIVRADSNGGKELLIPMKFLNKEGKGSVGSQDINPITLTGLFFGRNHLPNHLMFGGPGPSGATNIFNIGRSLVSNLGSMIEIFKGPNGMLLSKNCSKDFDPQKSWIRLQEPSGKKIGGGSRVKSIIMRDGWENMLGGDVVASDIDRYEKKYGQEYTYTLDNGTSSGVATYEPNICKENPLIQPFYHKPEKMSAQAYEETPFGESFYPNATVTYSKVKVKNITAADDDGTEEERKTKTGEVATYFYTSYNFPTKSEFTSLANPLNKYSNSNENEVLGNIIKGMFGLKIDVKTNLHMTQGFAIETNDMNGKMEKQEVINHAGEIISKVEYKYNVDATEPSLLNSNLTTIDEKGLVRTDHALGMHYDVINDFKESYSYSDVKGVSGNIDYIPIPLFGIVIGFGVPELSKHTQILRIATTTKVTHKTGILVEKIAYDLGSRVSTKNLAWDANTGQVLLTQTVNEFDESYYSFNYPAYWYYSNMGMASNNIDMSGVLKEIVSGSNTSYIINSHGGSVNVNTVFNLGDELIVSYKPDQLVDSFMYRKVWVSNIESNSIKLMTSNGYIFESDDLPEFVNFKILRSGKRNQQMASMASITLQKNPLQINSNGTGTLNHSLIDYSASEVENPFIINASAVEYSDDWPSQCEYMLPNHLGFINGQNFPVNPYLYNIKGVWRAKRSFAYLTGRNTSTTTRNSGFYKQFSPYYKFASGNWVTNAINWTFASEVSKYNPYGMELENKDALKRYSSAQYGYNYTLPMAVSSNAKYKEIGFDGFEDYNSNNYYNPLYFNPHFGFNEAVNSINHVTSKRSHTGKKAIVVKPNNSIKYNPLGEIK